MNKQKTSLKPTSTNIAVIGEKDMQRRELILRKYGEDGISVSFGLMKLVSESNKLENIAERNSLVSKYKAGMCLTRPNIHTLNLFSTKKEQAKLLLTITTLFMELNSWYKFSDNKKMNKTDCIEFSSMAMEKYTTWSLEDFMLFIHKAKRSIFGKAFDRVDPDLLWGWMDQYEDQVAYARERAQEDVAKSYNATEVLLDLKNHFKEAYASGEIHKNDQMNLNAPDKSKEQAEEDYRKFRQSYIVSKGSQDD